MTGPRADLHRLGGAGPALLLIHGFGADRYAWAATAPALFDVATVWAVDLPGHGGAQNAVGGGQVDDLARAVAAEIGTLQSPAVVVGHSLGGAVAIALARQMPQALRHLVLLAPAGLGGALEGDFLRQFPALQDEGQAAELLARLVVRKRLIAPAMIAHVLASLSDGARRAALAQIASALAQQSPPSLPQDIPVDVIWGEADAINTPPETLPAPATFLRLPDIGHLPYLEAASRVNGVIRAALMAGTAAP
jgi:pimeloyl-ACP methyl ester carboxylesterase